MLDGAENKDEINRINAAMALCRQGDCFLGERGLVHLCRVGEPNQKPSHEWLECDVKGLVLISQSCDLVRSCQSRPVVEACALVEVAPADMESIRRCKQPRLAFIPALAQNCLVADLDWVMTVEKAVLADLERTAGLSSDEDARRFAAALARKRARFAFPDDFNAYVRPLQERIVDKHNRQSDEGEALRQLQEIRVMAEPSWDADEVQLTFYFICDAGAPAMFKGKTWEAWQAEWMKRLRDTGRFKAPSSLVTDYAAMSAAEYLGSDQLDLDHLST